MAQHVNVDRERQLSCLAGALDHAPDAHPTEWVAALVDEGIGALDALGLLVAL